MWQGDSRVFSLFGHKLWAAGGPVEGLAGVEGLPAAGPLGGRGRAQRSGAGRVISEEQEHEHEQEQEKEKEKEKYKEKEEKKKEKEEEQGQEWEQSRNSSLFEHNRRPAGGPGGALCGGALCGGGSSVWGE